MTSPRIAIVGGGPAGLSLAELLAEKGFRTTTVFEALPQVGGKSFTVIRGDILAEMGTCYATYSHRIVLRWMKMLGLPLKGLGEQVFDGADFVKYVRKGYGASTPVQVIRYVRERARLMRQLQRPDPSPEALAEAAMPVSDWLADRRMGKIERLMERALSSIAYGLLQETPTLQALRWVDPELIASGLFKTLKMPVEGWGPFWEKLAARHDVRLNTPVAGIERLDDHVRIHTRDGTETFDHVVSAIPLDDFLKLAGEPSDDERFIADAVTWGGYTTTLVAVEDWFTGYQVEAWSRPIQSDAVKGRLLSARLEGYEPELGGHIYLTGQYTGEYTAGELAEILREDIASHGGRMTNVILQKLWKYMATYDGEAIRKGLLPTLSRVQGQNRTWYTGAIWSHEAVSHIVNFNAGLAGEMASAFSTQASALPGGTPDSAPSGEAA